MADIADLLANSMEGNATAFEASFSDIMADKVAGAIEAKYSEMYPGAEASAEPVQTGDE